MDLLLPLYLHLLVADLELCYCAITRTDEKVTVSQQFHAVDAELEELVAWTNSLEKSTIEIDLDDVTSESTHESTSVVGSDRDALVSSLDLAHLKVLEEDLFLDVVDIPDANAVIVDGHEVVGRIVVEADFIGNMHAN